MFGPVLRQMKSNATRDVETRRGYEWVSRESARLASTRREDYMMARGCKETRTRTRSVEIRC